MSRWTLRFWPLPVIYTTDNLGERFTLDRTACCIFMRELLKIDNLEDFSIDEISLPRTVPQSNIRNEMLVHFASIDDRDEIISHAINLKDHGSLAGVRLNKPDLSLIHI